MTRDYPILLVNQDWDNEAKDLNTASDPMDLISCVKPWVPVIDF